MLSIIALLLAAAASSSAAYFDGYNNVSSLLTPKQVRMSYQGPTAMMISWNTFGGLTQPTVKYGLEPYYLYATASSNDSTTYPTSLTYNNHVNITGLLPNTTYYYLPSNSNRTTPYSFRTARVAGDMSPFSVAVVVDMGTFGPLGLGTTTGVGAANPLKPGEQTTIAGISKTLDSFDFMVHPGDLAYADAWLKEEIQGYIGNGTDIPTGYATYEHINNAFYDELENITEFKPYMVSPGNHEANCDNGGVTDKVHMLSYNESICVMGQTNFTGYRNRFRMPSKPSGGVENFWYSYDHGMVHFVSIDTETDLGHGLTGPDEGSPEFGGPFGRMNAQIDWLTKDLAAVNRTKTPWVVALGHRPFYVSTTGVCANCTTAFEPLFYKYGVDLYFCGHSHVYERNAPVYQNKTDPAELDNPRATWYIVNGAAGHYDGLDTLNSPRRNYSRYAEDSVYSWSKLIFHNCTHMTQQAIASANGSVYDEATLFKNRTCAPGVEASFPYTQYGPPGGARPTGRPSGIPDNIWSGWGQPTPGFGGGW